MVNAGMVNGASAYFPPATFCESFRVFGQIPQFQNPFKYIRKSLVNHAAQPPVAFIETAGNAIIK
jgi:hypothetical protein